MARTRQHWQGIGAITDVPGEHDWAAIPAGTGDQIYYGPGIYSGDTHATRTVAGQHATSVGDSLCESGSFGGLLCNFTVSALNYSYHQTGPSQTWTDAGPGDLRLRAVDHGRWRQWRPVVLAGRKHPGMGHGHPPRPAGERRGPARVDEMFTPVTVATSDNGLVVNAG
jgi:hypothetical protein